MRVALGLGSNLQNPEKNIDVAVEHLANLGKLIARSHNYFSKPWGVLEQPDFCNAAIIIECDLAPINLLKAVKNIETTMGRVPTYTWGPRLIDIDILTIDDLQIDEPNLKVPHPHMHERAFVLVPLAEIDSSFGAMMKKLSKEDLESVWQA